MVIPKVQVQSIKATAQTAGGVSSLRCAIKCIGVLSTEAAKQLKIDLKATKNLAAFEVPREKGEVSLDFKIAQLTMGDQEDGAPTNFSSPGRQALFLPAASLHRYECARDDNGEIKVTMNASFDPSAWPAASDFMKADSGAVLDLTIAPEQKSMFPDGEDDAQDAAAKKPGRKKVARKKAAKKSAAQPGPEVVH